MSARFTQVGRQRALAMYADWTDRIAARRAAVRRRRRVRRAGSATSSITMWDWADPKVYLHDEIASDKRNPTVNANGPIYGALEESGDYLPVVDPKTQRDEPGEADGSRSEDAELRRYAAGGAVAVLGRRSDLEQPDDGPQLRDGQAGSRVGRGARPQARDAGVVPGGIGSSVGEVVPDQSEPARAGAVRSEDQADHDDRHLLHVGPREFRRQRRAVVVVRARRRRGLVRHEDLGQDARREDRRRAGARSSSTTTATASATRTPNRISRPIRRRTSGINVQFYGVSPAPDGSVWGSVQGMPGALVRFVPGSHPPETALAEYYEVPWNNPKAPVQGFAPRGMDVDSKGVVWTVLSSGHLASFDRRKCKGPLNGPTAATGQHCPEGWTLYPFPGPNYKGAVENGERRLGVLQLRRSVRHARRRQGRAACDRQSVRRTAGAGRRQVHDAARAVSDGLLRERHGRPHRQSERRLEGQGHLHAVSRRARRSTWKAARGPRASS